MMKIKLNNGKIFLIGFSALIIISVLIYNVVYFSSYYGFVQIDYFNSLFLIPFILLIFSFGMIIEQNKEKEKLKKIDSYNLTKTEKKIVLLILEKKKNQEIAEHMFVEVSTIKTHINNIYKKIGIKSRQELFYNLNP